MSESQLAGMAMTLVILSVVAAFTAFKDAFTSDAKRNLFLLSGVFSLWAIIVLLVSILGKMP